MEFFLAYPRIIAVVVIVIIIPHPFPPLTHMWATRWSFFCLFFFLSFCKRVSNSASMPASMLVSMASPRRHGTSHKYLCANYVPITGIGRNGGVDRGPSCFWGWSTLHRHTWSQSKPLYVDSCISKTGQFLMLCNRGIQSNSCTSGNSKSNRLCNILCNKVNSNNNILLVQHVAKWLY